MKAKVFEKSAWVSETRPDFLMGHYEATLKKCGFNILQKAVHFFSPFGFTGVFVLGESHLAIHTFPEEGKSYIQLSSCMEEMFNKFVELEKWGEA